MKDQTSAPNYIRIINWAWETIPLINGYKASYMTLFLGIIDSINRNKWVRTSIPYELLINKCGLSKQVYLDARQWLINYDLLEIELGKNGYQMAKFSLGLAVQNQTATITATDTADQSSNSDLPVQNQTATITHLKTVNISVKQKTVNIEFDTFYQLYDKKIGRDKARRAWEALTDEEREKAMEHIPLYKQAREDKTFRKDPERYLRLKTFNDEIIVNGKRRTNNQVRTYTSGERTGF